MKDRCHYHHVTEDEIEVQILSCLEATSCKELIHWKRL